MVSMLTEMPVGWVAGLGEATEKPKPGDDGWSGWGSPGPGWGGDGVAWDGSDGWNEDSSATPLLWGDQRWPHSGPSLPGMPWFGYDRPGRKSR